METIFAQVVADTRRSIRGTSSSRWATPPNRHRFRHDSQPEHCDPVRPSTTPASGYAQRYFPSLATCWSAPADLEPRNGKVGVASAGMEVTLARGPRPAALAGTIIVRRASIPALRKPSPGAVDRYLSNATHLALVEVDIASVRRDQAICGGHDRGWCQSDAGRWSDRWRYGAGAFAEPCSRSQFTTVRVNCLRIADGHALPRASDSPNVQLRIKSHHLLNPLGVKD
jgi:hypothetical protein